MVRVGARIGLAAVLLAGLSAAWAPPAAAVVEEQVGERVFLVRDKPGTPVHFQMIVQAGCGEEADGQCVGLAHYLEHLILVGRNPEHKDIAVRMFAEATSNGTTSQRATVYMHTVPVKETGAGPILEKLFSFYAARLKAFEITQADAARELNVVLQEHDQRVGSSPLRGFERRLDRELVPDHPSGQWTIGTRDSIQRLTLADAQAFHQKWYVINNVYFVIRGDIEAAELKGIAERTLAGLEAKALPARASLRQPAIPIERKDLRESSVQVKRASVIYQKMVRIQDGDRPRARAARMILVNFLRSRLPGSPHEAMVDKADVANATPSVSIGKVAANTYTLQISAEVAPDAAPQALLAAMSAYVDAMAANAPAPAAIERLKRRFADSRVSEDEDPAAIYSRLLAWLSNRSKYAEFRSWPQHVAEVSPADIAAAVTALTGPGKVVTGVLAPADEGAGK